MSTLLLGTRRTTVLVVALTAWIACDTTRTALSSWVRAPLWLFGVVLAFAFSGNHVAVVVQASAGRARPELVSEFNAWHEAIGGEPFIVVAAEDGGERAAHRHGKIADFTVKNG